MLHKLDPDGQGRPGARFHGPQSGCIIVADPDPGGVVRAIADKERIFVIVRGAGFAGQRTRQEFGAQAGTLLDHRLKHIGDDGGSATTHGDVLFGFDPPDGLALGINDRCDSIRPGIFAPIGKCGIGSRQLQQVQFGGAQRQGKIGTQRAG